MRSIFQQRNRERLLERLDRIAPDTAPLWGRMSAPKVIVHMSDQLRVALGELECAPKPGPFGRFPMKQLIIYWLPWPKGVPTAPELLGATPAEFESDRHELKELAARFSANGQDGRWAPHPAFGTLSGRAWGVLAYRHMDHHLRQFGA